MKHLRSVTSPNVQLADMSVHVNSDMLLRDLATLVSHRGVVFFKNQKLSTLQLRDLGSRLGELSGKPSTSTLHKHPISESTPELGADISVISSEG
jgi:alpha-ketoglutarate-dependent taurine dioxygenase